MYKPQADYYYDQANQLVKTKLLTPFQKQAAASQSSMTKETLLEFKRTPPAFSTKLGTQRSTYKIVHAKDKFYVIIYLFINHYFHF